MPSLIKDGVVVEDVWDGELLSLEAYNGLMADGAGPADNTAVQLEPGESPGDIAGDLNALPMVAIHFPVFTDGRGFSYARELRQSGYRGEIRAVGYFMRDQLGYLARCGFNAFAFAEDTDLQAALASLGEFSEHYQADVLHPEPLFRRR